MIVWSTAIIPAGGFGLASEQIAICGESAAKSLLGAPPVGMLYVMPPLYEFPHAARPRAAMRASGAARSRPFRLGVKVSMSASFVLRVRAAILTICCLARRVQGRGEPRRCGARQTRS